jgi:hypothetical protein
MDATRTSQAIIVAYSNHRLNPFSIHRKCDGFSLAVSLLLADILTVAKTEAVGAQPALPRMAALSPGQTSTRTPRPMSVSISIFRPNSATCSVIQSGSGRRTALARFIPPSKPPFKFPPRRFRASSSRCSRAGMDDTVRTGSPPRATSVSSAARGAGSLAARAAESLARGLVTCVFAAG